MARKASTLLIGFFATWVINLLRILLIVAIITAIAALPKWGRRRGVAVVALLLGVAGLAVAPLALGFDNLQRLITGDLRPIGIDATFSAERSAGIGELVVLGDGVAHRHIGWLVAVGFIGAALSLLALRALHKRLGPPS